MKIKGARTGSRAPLKFWVIILSFPSFCLKSSLPLSGNHRAPGLRGKNPATSTPGPFLCAVQAPALRNAPSPLPIHAASRKAIESTQSSPASACGLRIRRGSPLNLWPSAPQTLHFQALFCERPPGADRAIPPGFCPFPSLMMGCLEECLSSISAGIHTRKKFIF